MIESGKLRDLIEIQGYTLEQDTRGNDIKAYGEGTASFASVYASIKTLRGNELFRAQQDFPEAQVEIEMRYVAGVNEQMRVLDVRNVVYYDILNVNDVERRHRKMVLTCRGGVSETDA